MLIKNRISFFVNNVYIFLSLSTTLLYSTIPLKTTPLEVLKSLNISYNNNYYIKNKYINKYNKNFIFDKKCPHKSQKGIDFITHICYNIIG